MGREVMPAKELPISEIKYASAMGFLTKAVWREFFAKGNVRWQNRRWKSLSTSGIFKAHQVLPNVLLPNPRHALVKHVAPVVARPPLFNQVDHDEIVGRSLLMLQRSLPTWQIQTESELKRIYPISNKGKPLLSQQKHPDLLIRSPFGDLIAIELELNQKSRGRYKQALRNYRGRSVGSIIFVIRSAGTKAAVRQAAKEVLFPEDKIGLGFCSLKDWQQSPVATDIYFSKATYTLANIAHNSSRPKIGLAEAQPGANADFSAI